MQWWGDVMMVAAGSIVLRDGRLPRKTTVTYDWCNDDDDDDDDEDEDDLVYMSTSVTVQ
jgi:hypothetical protein